MRTVEFYAVDLERIFGIDKDQFEVFFKSMKKIGKTRFLPFVESWREKLGLRRILAKATEASAAAVDLYRVRFHELFTYLAI